MPKLVSHEREIALSSKTERDESDHLVESHSSKNSECFLAEDTHVCVYFSIEEPHGNGLIADKGLIVAFGIGDAWLFVSSIGQLKSYLADFPILIFLLFQQLDPHVGNCHGQSEPKTYSSFLYRSAKSRKP